VFLGGAAIAALAGAGPAFAAGDAFTVSGKKGPFLKQVSGRDFGIGKSGGDGAMGLASDAMSRGRFQSARLRMPQTEARIAEMVAKLDANWPYAKAPAPEVHVIGLDYYNAYSLPDNSIVVGFGLLDQAQSDDEVAFILAHEIGHIRLGHFAHAAKARDSGLPSRLGQLYVVGSAAAAGAHGGVGAFNAEAQAAAERAGATNDLLHFLNRSMVEPSHTRAQEDEADAIGYDLSSMAAYSADTASAKVFDTIQADTQKRQAYSDALQKQLTDDLSHAISPGQVQSLVSGNMSRSDMAGSALRVAGALARNANRNGDDAPKHRAPEERKKGIAQYSVDAYPQGAPLRDEQKAWLGAVRSTKEYAQAKLAVAAVYDAMKARAAGDYPTASAALVRAKATSFGGSPLVVNERARLTDDMGDGPGADKLFRVAHQSPDQSVQGYVDHVRMLWRRGENEPADEIIRAGVRRFDDDDKPFLSLQIAVARQAGRDSDVDSLLNRCAGYNDAALTHDCQLAAGHDPNARQATSVPHVSTPSLPFSIPGLPHP
jgi:Zn-dependent protease with chaperone function